jgi:DNA repair protein RecN (Recombination protein N)
MLSTLRIKNLALVADLTLSLNRGYNAITGETGAGKSILIGALNLALGERADRTLIRSGSESCSVEAVFDIAALGAPLKAFLEENGLEPCEDDQLVLKRTFTSAGANRQFINGSPTTLNILAALGQWLVDIHGPHEHQSLLHPSRQLAILDAFGNLSPLREKFADLLRQSQAVLARKSDLIVDEKTFAQQLDLLRFQFNEIKAARLEPDEEPALHHEYQRVSNSARLLQLSQAALGFVSEDDDALAHRSGILGRTLQEIQKIDPGAAPLTALHEQLISDLRELQSAIAAYSDRLEIDPVRLQELEERLNLIQGLKRKYGSTVSDIIDFGQKALQQLINLEQRDAELIRIENELRALKAELLRVGEELSSQRRKIIPKLSKSASRQLAELGFKQSQFNIEISSQAQIPDLNTQISPSGLDTIEFQFAPNPGEPARPLRNIASSGELARVMLALKTVLSAQDEIPVLVFDEVDANVGGETAHAVADKMRQISQQRQVLCITHLAPVAGPADAHYVVTKEMHDARTVTSIRMLDRNGRITELARMLGGQSEAARKHAEELLNKQK